MRCCDLALRLGVFLALLFPAMLMTPLILVSFVSPSISSYAAYSTAINELYAQHKGYTYLVLTPEMGYDYEPSDRRWNRVKILLSLMEDASTGGYVEANTTTYYMWMDADLIVLDFNMNIESHIIENQDHDIIISSEWHAETGVANTGCFIIKHSTWSYNFLLKWWNNYDHSINHDQIFFDVLYKSMPLSDQNHIKILPTESLNSIPPAMLHQQDHHQFLHLMGERNELREIIFERAWNSIVVTRETYANSFADHLPMQLGLSQPTLLATALDYYDNHLVSLESDLQSVPTPQLHASIGEIREILLQKLILTKHSIIEVQAARLVLMRLYNLVQNTIASGVPTRDSTHYQEDVGVFIQSLNLGALIGNDLVQYTSRNGNDERIASLLEEVHAYLVTLLSYVSTESSMLIYEMLVSHYNTAGAYYSSIGDTDVGIQYYDLSVQTFANIKGGNVFRVLQPLQSLANAQCNERKYAVALDAYYNATVTYFDVLKDEQQVKEDYRQFFSVLRHFSDCVQQARGEGYRGRLAPLRSLNLLRIADILLQNPLLYDVRAELQVLHDYSNKDSDVLYRKAHKRKKRKT